MSVKDSRTRHHSSMASQGLLKRRRGKQALRAQEELNELWQGARRQGPPQGWLGVSLSAALVQDGECQMEDPYKPFRLIARDGRLYYCCTHPTQHCFFVGLADG